MFEKLKGVVALKKDNYHAINLLIAVSGSLKEAVPISTPAQP